MRKRTWALSTNLFTLFAVLWALAAAAATAMRFHWAVLWLAVLLFIAYLAYRKVYLPYVRIEKVFGRYIS
ncbi:MAG: hypothetical protein FWG37_02715, partial [Clostridia bacterium]|nr:hypothetical protein [Clostridia bacterium]